MTDRFEELRTFVAIVEAGGVNAAAAKVGIARSAVSRRLSDLEKRLGKSLVERSTRRFELTDMGRALYEDSKRLLADLAAIDARFEGGTVAEQVTILVERDLAPIIAPALASFRAEHVDAVLVLLTESDANDADVTVSVTEGRGGRRLAEATRIMVCAPAYLAERAAPSTPGELAGHVGVSVRGAPDEWTFRGGISVHPTIGIEVPDAATALVLVVQGAGLAQLPGYVCSSDLSSGALVSVLDAHAPAPKVIVAQGNAESTFAAALVDHLATAIS